MERHDQLIINKIHVGVFAGNTEGISQGILVEPPSETLERVPEEIPVGI